MAGRLKRGKGGKEDKKGQKTIEKGRVEVNIEESGRPGSQSSAKGKGDGIAPADVAESVEEVTAKHIHGNEGGNGCGHGCMGFKTTEEDKGRGNNNSAHARAPHE